MCFYFFIFNNMNFLIIYNIDKKSSNNIDTKIYYEKILKSKKYDENIIDMLNI